MSLSANYVKRRVITPQGSDDLSERKLFHVLHALSALTSASYFCIKATRLAILTRLYSVWPISKHRQRCIVQFKAMNG